MMTIQKIYKGVAISAIPLGGGYWRVGTNITTEAITLKASTEQEMLDKVIEITDELIW